MATTPQSPQRIARLVPLTDVLAWIDANVRTVAPREAGIADALGRTLAQEIRIAHAMPAQAICLRDGFALQSDWTSDASSYAPAPLPQAPLRVGAGDALPPGADCVAALDDVAIRGERAEALAVVAPGDGILPAGGDAAADQSLLNAGRRLRASDVALLCAATISRVIIRAPCIRVVRAGGADDIIASAAQMMAAAIVAEGGTISGEDGALASALQDNDADAVIAIGGTGAGRNDASVTALAGAGQVAFHGIGLRPGETAAIGVANAKPVLVVPGRIDAALACWLMLGQRVFARLAGRDVNDVAAPVTLTRKITSTIGIADVVLLKRSGSEVEPLASGYWPVRALAQADSYCVVAPESEGFPAGAIVSARALP